MGSVTEMLTTTEAAPVGGTPPRPAMGSTRVLLGPGGPMPEKVPSMVPRPGRVRVSNSRVGEVPLNEGPAGNQPRTSTMRWVVPARL